MAVTGIRALDRLSDERLEGIGFVYLGSSFCEELQPSVSDIEQAAARLDRLGVSLVVVTAPVTENRLDRLRALSNWIVRANRPPEIVVNDWGAFDLLSRTGVNVTVGRTLTKGVRDPRLAQLAAMGSLGGDAVRYYEHSCASSDRFVSFVKSLGAARLEIDVGSHQQDLSVLAACELPLSIYERLSYVTCGQRCPFRMAAVRAREPDCRLLCTETYLELSFGFLDRPLLGVGNAIYARSGVAEAMPGSTLNRCRLIYEVLPGELVA